MILSALLSVCSFLSIQNSEDCSCQFVNNNLLILSNESLCASTCVPDVSCDLLCAGKKQNDVNHPDYVPSVFPHKPASSPRKLSNVFARYQRAKKRQLQLSTAAQPVIHPEAESGPPVISEESESAPISLDVDFLLSQNRQLCCERDQAFVQLRQLQLEMHVDVMSADSVRGDDTRCQEMIGLAWETFSALFLYLSAFVVCSSVYLPAVDQLFITLVKLRHNPSFSLLAHTSRMSKSTIISVFWKWTDALYCHIGFLVHWPDREDIFRTIPPVFKSKFPRLTSIIDCFEIFTDAPKDLHAHAQCWSNYKKHCTVKVFICCNPHGAVTFLSPVWGGRVSDVKIVRDSGFISSRYHMPGDQILADRGFTLHDDFATSCSAELITPAFTKGKKQLTAREVEYSRQLSSVRIHVERVIGLLKNRYTILKGPLPVKMINSMSDEACGAVVSSCDKIVKVCASLINLNASIVAKSLSSD